MDTQDKKYVADVINYFWGPNLVTSAQINQHIATVTYEALTQANTCSNAMDLVPRPTYSKPNITYIIKQLSGIGKRIVSGDSDIYNVCKITVSASYRNKIRLALMGL
jgi:hypothetical protein